MRSYNFGGGGRALRIAVGITALVLLLAGGAEATKSINDNATGGDCTSIGTWNVASKTCTLATDLTETIEIDSDGITLSGNGHTITGSSDTVGINLTGRNGVTIKNTNVRNFKVGIDLYSSSNNMLSGNNANWNNRFGIYLYKSSNNTLLNNTMTANSLNFILDGGSDSDFNNQIDYSNTVDGKPIYYVKNAKNTLYDSSTNAGTFYCISCVNVTIKDMNLNKNGRGVFFWNTTRSTIQNVNASNNVFGIDLWSSSNNTLSGNNANLNNAIGIILLSCSNNTLSGNNANSWNGIDLESSSNNTLSGNNANSNNYYGIILGGSSNNTLSGNNASNNSEGIHLISSSNNSIYNNFFSNTNNVFSNNSTNTWNTTKTPGTNIIGGSYLGGNFWVNPNDTGLSQTCADNNSDGICDSPYTLDSSNIDYLPLAYIFTQPINSTQTSEITKVPSVSPTEKAETVKSPTIAPTEKAAGFELVLVITTLLSVYIFIKKRS